MKLVTDREGKGLFFDRRFQTKYSITMDKINATMKPQITKTWKCGPGAIVLKPLRMIFGTNPLGRTKLSSNPIIHETKFATSVIHTVRESGNDL